MTFKRKIIVTVYLVITLVVCFGSYVFFGVKNRKDYSKAQKEFGVAMRQAFDVGDYSRCVSTMERSSKLMQEKTTKKRNLFTSIHNRQAGPSGISYFYTTLYPARKDIEDHLSCEVDSFLQEACDGVPAEKCCYRNNPWQQLGKSMAKSADLHLQLLGLWLTRDDVEIAKVLFDRIDRGEKGFACYITTTIIDQLEGVSAEDKFNYYLKALVIDYPKLKGPQHRMDILEQMQHTKNQAVFLKANAIKSGMLEIGASEKIIAAFKQCWGEEYPEDTRYFIRHLDSYISGPENLEPQIDAWLKANPH